MPTYRVEKPPLLRAETIDQYTDRLTGADGTGRKPYPETRNRQCSIGYHWECTQITDSPADRRCQCPCHAAIDHFWNLLSDHNVVTIEVLDHGLVVRGQGGAADVR